MTLSKIRIPGKLIVACGAVAFLGFALLDASVRLISPGAGDGQLWTGFVCGIAGSLLFAGAIGFAVGYVVGRNEGPK